MGCDYRCDCVREERWKNYLAMKATAEAEHPREDRVLIKRAILPKQDPATKKWFWLSKVRIEQHSFFGLALGDPDGITPPFPVLKWATNKVELAV